MSDINKLVEAARIIVERWDRGLRAQDGEAEERGIVRLLAAYQPPPPPVDSEQSERADYWRTVAGIAQDALEAWRDADWDDDARYEAVWEGVDGSQYIIYTCETLRVFQFTDNDGAWEDLGPLDSTKGWEHVLQQIAFCAMRADVEDKIRDMEDDYRAQHGPPDSEPEEEEEEDAPDAE